MPRRPKVLRSVVDWVRSRIPSSAEKEEHRRSEEIEQRQKQRVIAYEQWLKKRNRSELSSHRSEEEQEQRLQQQIEQARRQRELAYSQWQERQQEVETDNSDPWPGQ